MNRFFKSFALMSLLALALPLLAMADEATRVKAPAELEIKGALKSIALEKTQFVVTVNNKDLPMHLAFDGKVVINNQPGTLAELRAGDEVLVTYKRDDFKLVATRIECRK
jgi:hypothetical protein